MAAEIEDSLWRQRKCASIPERRVSSASFARVGEPSETQEITCPHCKKPFDGTLLAEGSRHEGFKCPHCRLFVPVERVNGDS